MRGDRVSEGGTSFLDGLAADGPACSAPTGAGDPWRILVVDDDREVHAVTRLVLRDLRFDGRSFEIRSAYGYEEARAAFAAWDRVALVLLDVVMQRDDDGLRLVRWIREDRGDRSVRIILRTGHQGEAPEQEIVAGYDINDYKEKTELTAQRLRTAVLAALRSYRDVIALESERAGLDRIVRSMSSLYGCRDGRRLAGAALAELAALVAREGNAVAPRSGMAVTREGGRLRVLAAFGEWSAREGDDPVSFLPAEGVAATERAYASRGAAWDSGYLAAYAGGTRGGEEAFVLGGAAEPDAFGLKISTLFARSAAAAFDNAALSEEVEATQREVVFTLGEAAERRSRETGNHVMRVSGYSQLLARELGMSDDEVSLLGFAAPTHDIGKIAIPDEILNKPSPLDEDEMRVMRSHTVLGEAMLGRSGKPILAAGAVIARSHHECWDGSGYPDGLSGERIPVFARIVAIADVFDSLGHDRVYGRAWSKADVERFMRDGSGTMFDPRMTDAFLSRLGSFFLLMERFPD
jgi:response regulator RpfG family c-di-GMP phosphodiesterase